MQEVLVGFKEQTEALIDYIGYYEYEKKYGRTHRVAFDFYHLEECQELMTKKNINNPTIETTSIELKNSLPLIE